MNTVIKVLLCVIILFIVLYVYYDSRVPGCMDKNAINYNSNANLSKVDSCVYQTVGCTDSTAVNYNQWANVSCTEDCSGSTKSKCEFNTGCSSMPQNLCKYNVKGCNRVWSNNYDDNANVDNNSCLTQEELMNRIVVLSGGACNGCSNKVYIKIDNDYIVNGGSDGINMVVIDRNVDIITNKIVVRYVKSFNTAVDKIESQNFVTFCNNYLYSSDIVIIAIKGDFIGQYNDVQQTVEADSNPNSNYLQQVISIDAQSIFKLLGAQYYEVTPNTSYVLIGSLLLDIYFESTNSSRDAFYPLFNLVNIGCINIYDPKIVKTKLKLSNNLMLASPSLETDEFIWRCALEAHSNGYSIFYIKGMDCYVADDIITPTPPPAQEIDNIYKNVKDPIFYKPFDKFTKGTYARTYLLNNYMASSEPFDKLLPTSVNNDICSINQFYETTGNTTSENWYVIVEGFHDRYYLSDFSSLYTYIYTGDNFTGLKTALETGIQMAIKIFSLNQSDIPNGGFSTLQTLSIEVPIHHFVIAFKTVFTDPKLNDSTVKEYYMFSGPDSNDIKKKITYKQYPIIAKDPKYPTTISKFIIINGYMGVNIFESNKYSGLVIRLGYGRYVLPDLYITPYFWKITNMLKQIIYDLKLIKIFVDTDGNDTTLATISTMFAQQLPLTALQIQASLSGIFELLGYPNYIELANKYTALVDGFQIGSIISYIKGNACVRFFSDTAFANLLYTFKLSSEIPAISIPNNVLCKAIIIDKLGSLQIYNDLNPKSIYYNLGYTDLVQNVNYISVLSIKESVNSTVLSIKESDNSTVIDPWNWNQNIGIPIDKEVSIIRLKSYLDADNVNSYYFLNVYKGLYDQLRSNLFNLLNFTGDDIIYLPQYKYYIAELTKNVSLPTTTNKSIKLGKYENGTNFTISNTVLLNNYTNCYFYSVNDTIAYYGIGTDIYIVNLPIYTELKIMDFSKTSLNGYNMNIKYGMICLTSSSNQYYHITNGQIYDGTDFIDYKLLSLVGYSNIIIYNMDLVTTYKPITKNNLFLLNDIYGALVVKNNNTITKHIPIFRNQYWDNYRWNNIDKISSNIYYNDLDLSYYNLLDINSPCTLIFPINNNPVTNMNQISGLKSQLNLLQVSCRLEVYYTPLSVNNTNYQGYTFKNVNNSVIFYSGTRMISVNSGNWLITFTHELNTVDPVYSYLYIPGPNTSLVSQYDRSVYNGTVILNYLNNKLVNTITSDLFFVDNSYDHIFNVKKYWPSTILKGLEPVYIEYYYKTNRWLIKMPMNSPVKKIEWTRYYGNSNTYKSLS
jgi:hypothetical protein